MSFILALASSAAFLFGTLLIGSWLALSFSSAGSLQQLLISRGHTSWSGRRILFPLCSKTTPLTTPSLPLTSWITLPFFHSPRFLLSPTTRTISPISGICCLSLLFTLCASIKLWTYSFCQRLHACSLAFFRRLCSLVTSSSPTSISSKS